MQRRKLAFLGVLAIVSTLYAFCIFAPILYLTIDGKLVYMNIIGYAQKCDNILYVIGTIAGPVVALAGSIFLWMSFLEKESEQGDRKDKHYLLGTLIFVLGAVVGGVNGMVSGTYIHMMISVILAIIYGALIYVHNKYLTTY